jgi:hypothetical protein
VIECRFGSIGRGEIRLASLHAAIELVREALT